MAPDAYPDIPALLVFTTGNLIFVRGTARGVHGCVI
jgi:hypothetical protein